MSPRLACVASLLKLSRGRGSLQRDLRLLHTALRVGRRYRRGLAPAVAAASSSGSAEEGQARHLLFAEPECFLLGSFARDLARLHGQSARDIAQLCRDNAGAYIKVAQFLSVRSDIPKEYRQALAQLQDDAPKQLRFATVNATFLEDFGCSMEEAFRKVDREALAAASLAQVHRAQLQSGEEVAVKVQFPWVRRQVKHDMRMLAIVAPLLMAWIQQKGGPRGRRRRRTVQVDWILQEVSRNLEAELDFTREAENVSRVRNALRGHPRVRVPETFEQFTSSRVLTMQYIPGKKPRREVLDALSIRPGEFAGALAEANAVLALRHGHLHCDLHPGNLLVCSRRELEAGADENGWMLFLIDHGMNRAIRDSVRRLLCRLWTSVHRKSHADLLETCMQLGVGKDDAMFYPLLFEGDPNIQERAWQCLPRPAKEAAAQHIDRAKKEGTVLAEALRFAQALPVEMLSVQRMLVLQHFVIEEACRDCRSNNKLVQKLALDRVKIYQRQAEAASRE